MQRNRIDVKYPCARSSTYFAFSVLGPADSPCNTSVQHKCEVQDEDILCLHE